MKAAHVLVVDDSRTNRAVAAAHLKTAGYRVTMAESGEEALVALVAEPTDLVLLDVMMPGLGGYETCRQIRATPAIADVAVLFLTALGDTGTTGPALEAGADDLLAKPFNHAELLLRVRALIRQREQARQLAAQHEALRRIGQMIVHDLRGPTSAIMANAAMLCDEGLTGDAAEAASDILMASGHLERTINDLLDLSMSADIGIQLQLEPLDLHELVTAVASALRGSGRWKAVTIACDVRVDQLVGDGGLLRRMLQNLVHNAVKHAPKGSEVTIEVTADGEAALMRVIDRGPGIAAADVERIFERYVSSGSHGLGLAFCRLVVELHGGRIWVEPNEPSGAVFCVRLPRQVVGEVGRVPRPGMGL